jgi:hypothetical protein
MVTVLLQLLLLLSQLVTHKVLLLEACPHVIHMTVKQTRGSKVTK